MAGVWSVKSPSSLKSLSGRMPLQRMRGFGVGVIVPVEAGPATLCGAELFESPKYRRVSKGAGVNGAALPLRDVKEACLWCCCCTCEGVKGWACTLSELALRGPIAG